jgi:hypothetical protein
MPQANLQLLEDCRSSMRALWLQSRPPFRPSAQDSFSCVRNLSANRCWQLFPKTPGKSVLQILRARRSSLGFRNSKNKACIVNLRRSELERRRGIRERHWMLARIFAWWRIHNKPMPCCRRCYKRELSFRNTALARPTKLWLNCSTIFSWRKRARS